ncbi:MAG TPA: hypothetical protein VNL18_12500 [Gemmatimonadales bacterium]|nr:hypothetical protein [Gemmatimonadales bacterium]
MSEATTREHDQHLDIGLERGCHRCVQLAEEPLAYLDDRTLWRLMCARVQTELDLIAAVRIQRTLVEAWRVEELLLAAKRAQRLSENPPS